MVLLPYLCIKDMAKKKIIRAEDITDKDILSLYERLLPLLYYNPEKLTPHSQLNKRLLEYVQYDFYHFVLNEANVVPSYHHFRMVFEDRKETNPENNMSHLHQLTFSSDNPDEIFDALIKHTYQSTIERKKIEVPDKPEYHYYELISRSEPKVMVGFFRFKNKEQDNGFTKNELLIFDKLAPYIFILFRSVLNPFFQTKEFQYFDAYTQICSNISHEYSLSVSESKILPEILLRFTNEEIAKRNFVSPATIKKHLRSIFKKTETKNRVDFIGKFFTSPDIY